MPANARKAPPSSANQARSPARRVPCRPGSRCGDSASQRQGASAGTKASISHRKPPTARAPASAAAGWRVSAEQHSTRAESRATRAQSIRRATARRSHWSRAPRARLAGSSRSSSTSRPAGRAIPSHLASSRRGSDSGLARSRGRRPLRRSPASASMPSTGTATSSNSARVLRVGETSRAFTPRGTSPATRRGRICWYT